MSSFVRWRGDWDVDRLVWSSGGGGSLEVVCGNGDVVGEVG